MMPVQHVISCVFKLCVWIFIEAQYLCSTSLHTAQPKYHINLQMRMLFRINAIKQYACDRCVYQLHKLFASIRTFQIITLRMCTHLSTDESRAYMEYLIQNTNNNPDTCALTPHTKPVATEFLIYTNMRIRHIVCTLPNNIIDLSIFLGIVPKQFSNNSHRN